MGKRESPPCLRSVEKVLILERGLLTVGTVFDRTGMRLGEKVLILERGLLHGNHDGDQHSNQHLVEEALILERGVTQPFVLSLLKNGRHQCDPSRGPLALSSCLHWRLTGLWLRRIIADGRTRQRTAPHRCSQSEPEVVCGRGEGSSSRKGIATLPEEPLPGRSRQSCKAS